MHAAKSSKSSSFSQKNQGQFADSRRATILKDDLASDPVCAEQYFYGLLPREDVEMMLLHEGEFLVRQTKKVCAEASGAVISVRSKSEVIHVVVLKSPKGFLLEEKGFPTIKKLISHYHDNRIVLTKESGAVLKTPVHRAKWVLHESQLKLIEKLGEGQFGEVWKAEMTRDDGFKEMVAVKRLKSGELPPSEQKSFFDECRRQRQLRHIHIVNFKGVSLDSAIMLVMELCDIPLLKYVRNYQGKLTHKEVLKLIVHASRGMAYLASEKIIHRDLAARNCLIKHGRLKISDLGMARTGEMYKMNQSKQKPLPIKWIPPDTLLNRNYSEKSDVWAFGILIWEIITCGCSPYVEVGIHSKQPFIIELISYLRQGHRLQAPSDTNPDIKKIMNECWHADPEKRPKFVDINKRLEALYKDAMGPKSSLNMNSTQASKID